jgi:hypothetical protein
VLGTARTLVIRKSPSVLFKIDLAKTFDSVNLVFSLTFSRPLAVQLDGQTGFLFYYLQRALRFSLMESQIVVFVMVVGSGRVIPYHQLLLFWLWSSSVPWLSLSIPRVCSLPCGRVLLSSGVSLYADDVVVFLSPVMLDLVMIKEILKLFCRATSLATNLNKCKAFPIRR